MRRRSIASPLMPRAQRRCVLWLEGRRDGSAGGDGERYRGPLRDVGETLALLRGQFDGDGDGALDTVVIDVVTHIDLDRGELPTFARRVHAQRRRRARRESAEHEPER